MATTAAVRILERLASETWHRLVDAHRHGFSIGEETITDLNLLEIAKSGNPCFRTRQVSKKMESKIGADWVWWIGNKRCGWIQYAVQAKKLDPVSRSYRAFRKPKGQLSALEGFCRRARAIPLYCLYNGDVSKPPMLSRHESRCEQYGCTIVNFERVKTVYTSRGTVRFADLHQGDNAHPWRCLISEHCDWLTPSAGNSRHPLVSHDEAAELFQEIRFARLPIEIEQYVSGELKDFPESIYPPDSDRPRYVLVTDLDVMENRAS